MDYRCFPVCCRAGLLLTQAPMSPGRFAFDTQLPDSGAVPTQLPPLDDLQLQAGARTPVAASPAHQNGQQQQQQQQPAASEGCSLQGSAGSLPGGDGADSNGGSRPRSGQSWLLSPLGALAQVFKRTAAQVGRWKGYAGEVGVGG